jgi:hypothetical protein
MNKSIILFGMMLFVVNSFSTVMAQQETDAYQGLKLNEIQLIGSHNSYKPGIEPALWKMIYAKDSNAAISLQYGHIGFSQQLDMGLRNLEIDIVHDPLGGRYKNPMGIQWLKAANIEPQPFDIDDDLSKPGLKVFHVPDIDFRSNHLLFIDCLKELKHWSDEHPAHMPVIITMNAKDSDAKGLHLLLPFTNAALDSIDMEILTVFSKDQLITPDLVRGNAASLEQAVLQNGWPLLSAVKGRFLFVLDETGEKLAAYTSGHPSLQGRLLFVNEKAGNAEAAFMIMNDPKKDGDKIRELVKKGYLIRTRADANTAEARKSVYRMFDAAQASGAQIITTDYYLPSIYFSSTYKVAFDDGKYVRKNPVLKAVQ